MVGHALFFGDCLGNCDWKLLFQGRVSEKAIVVHITNVWNRSDFNKKRNLESISN